MLLVDGTRERSWGKQVIPDHSNPSSSRLTPESLHSSCNIKKKMLRHVFIHMYTYVVCFSVQNAYINDTAFFSSLQGSGLGSFCKRKRKCMPLPIPKKKGLEGKICWVKSLRSVSWRQQEIFLSECPLFADQEDAVPSRCLSFLLDVHSQRELTWIQDG